MVMNCQNLFLKEHVLILVSMIFTLEKDSDFSGCCLGVGTRYDMLTELSRREKEAGIKPDPEIDAFMKVTSIEGQETSLVTYYILKVWLCYYF
ncbi:hypothetical protein MtrunA17_Chr8g0390451 [Medicago truncatula]|uniref:Uncharacterized protein n=1 Tax=Medicago truncatula TaxID=3880 RepID=A0A396GXX1_MEDTR|nr:hypothetical protein MtrunA17_Chr8g0390451 [Medicago truncatula]